MEKKTLIVMHSTMAIGGVQQNFVDLMRYAVSQGHRVIWLYAAPMRIADAYKDILSGIEAIEYTLDYTNTVLTPKLHLEKDETVKWLTSIPSDMHRVILYASQSVCKNITPLYVISNTKGRYNYIENYYWGPFKKVVYKRYQDIVQKWHECGLIRYFDIKHFDTYKSVYGIDYDKPMDLVWKYMYPLPPLDESALAKRVERKVFNIISVTRFDFPHKQYLLGLIKDFANLKKKYCQLQLHIVGYGQDENIVKNLIASLPTSTQSSITLYGQKSEKEIKVIMQSMHLNISVAACVGLGAMNGVLSIPARNFCGDELEVYGYLPNSRNMTVSTDPGERALKYIEDVINMLDEVYMQKCIDSYNAYEIKDVDPDFMLRQEGNTSDFSFEKDYNRFFNLFVKTRDYFWKIGDICSNVVHK